MKPTLKSICLSAALLLGAAQSHAATATKSTTVTDLTGSTPGAWTGGGGTNGSPGSSDTASWTDSSLGAGLTLNSNVTWKNIIVTGASSNIDISGTGTITMSGGIDMTSSTVDMTISNRIIHSGYTASWKVAAGKTLTVGDYSVPGYNYNKSGAGTLIFQGSGSNGALGLNLNGGKVVLNKTSSSTAHAVGSTLNVSRDSTLQLSGTGDNQIANNVNVSMKSGGVFDLNGRSETIGPLKLVGTGIADGGALINSLASSSATLTGSISLQGASSMGGAGNLAIAGIVSGSNHALTKIGSGTLTLNGVNTYSGDTTISAGTLALGSGGSINDSPSIIIPAGNTLDVSAKSIFTLSGTNCLSVSGTGTTIGSNAAVIKGGTTVNLGNRPINLTFKPSAFTGDSTHPSLLVTQGALSLSNNSFTINNVTTTPLGAGTYRLIEQSLGNVGGSVTGSSVSITGAGLAYNCSASLAIDEGKVNIVVIGNQATVILTNLEQIFNDTPKSVGAMTVPAGVNVDLTYNGSPSPPTAVGTYTVVGTIKDVNTYGTATGTLVINNKTATNVTLGSLNQTYTGSALTPSTTTTPAGLTVNFTYNGITTAPAAPGRYTVVGSVNDASYSGFATGTLAISPADPTGLTANEVNSSGQLTLNWNPAPGAAAYIIKRATTSGGTYTTVKTVTTNSWVDTTVNARQRYYYKVSSVAYYSESVINNSIESTKPAVIDAVAWGPSIVKLPHIFGDHMVLQRDKDAPVWGTANPGDKITVTVGATVGNATAGADGKWMVRLKGLPVSNDPLEMSVRGPSNTVNFTDVLVGDVWLASGQSNMELGINLDQNKATERDKPTNNKIRCFYAVHSLSAVPSDVIGESAQYQNMGKWYVVSKFELLWGGYGNGFSAVAYFFARDIAAYTGIPVGMIQSAYSGTPAEAWCSIEALSSDPALSTYAATSAKLRDDHLAGKKTTAGYMTPSAQFNGAINPYIPYGLKGFIWYQGENNTSRPEEYRIMLPAMINDWRAKWGRNDLAFLLVQLPTEDGAAPMRQAQTYIASLPNNGMCVTYDIGPGYSVTDGNARVHPTYKSGIGIRLALAARKVAYGDPKVVHMGPSCTSVKIEGNKARVHFDNVGSGLKIGVPPADWYVKETRVGTDKLLGFQVAGSDGVYHDATATIDGVTVVASSPNVPAPVLVRYGYKGVQYGKNNLYNKEDLPAVPFRSDELFKVNNSSLEPSSSS